MRGEDDAAAFGDLCDEAPHEAPTDRVHARARLILRRIQVIHILESNSEQQTQGVHQENDGRVANHGDAEREFALVAARVGARSDIGELGQTCQLIKNSSAKRAKMSTKKK